MQRDTNLYLEDIVDACRKIEIYTKGLTFAEFDANSKTVDAVVRN